MFDYDRGLRLTRAELAIDMRRRMPRGFISHAHTDHMGRHTLALCTPETARLYQHRLGPRDVLELPCRQPLEFHGLELTTYPAGHCLGSAMLLADDGHERFLYTGDFRLGASLTCEEAELPEADLLVMESTYGDPRYRHMPREVAAEKLIDVARAALRRGATPVVQAYALGKAQEVTRVLTDAGLGVMQHDEVWQVSRVYEACGVSLGAYRRFEGLPLEGHALIVPPRFHRPAHAARIKQAVHIAVTGWAGDRAMAARWRVDHAIEFSDHADFDQLLEAVSRVRPRFVYCTHGPASFAEHLRKAGWRTEWLGTPSSAEQLAARRKPRERLLF